MKLVTGIVSHLRHSVEVSGNQHGVGTSQILAFRIGKQAVQLGMSSLPQIEAGDEVAVAGRVVDGVLIAEAYRNLDNNAHGEWKHAWLSATVLTAIFVLPFLLLFALSLLRSSDPAYSMLIFLLPGSPFPFMMIARIFRAIQTAAASRMVWSIDE